MDAIEQLQAAIAKASEESLAEGEDPRKAEVQIGSLSQGPSISILIPQHQPDDSQKMDSQKVESSKSADIGINQSGDPEKHVCSDDGNGKLKESAEPSASREGEETGTLSLTY